MESYPWETVSYEEESSGFTALGTAADLTISIIPDQDSHEAENAPIPAQNLERTNTHLSLANCFQLSSH